MKDKRLKTIKERFKMYMTEDENKLKVQGLISLIVFPKPILDHLFQSWANSHFEGQEIMGVVMIGAFLWLGKELAQKRFFRGSIAAIVFAWGFYYFAVARFDCPCGYGG